MIPLMLYPRKTIPAVPIQPAPPPSNVIEFPVRKAVLGPGLLL